MDSPLKHFSEAITSSLYTGYSLKVDFMPATPVKCILLELDDSGSSSKFFGQANAINSPIVIMTVRSETYDAGFTVCENIRKLFNAFTNTDFLGISAIGSTAVLGKDVDGNRRFMAQFAILIKE